MDEADDETESPARQSDVKEPLFPPSPPRASSRLANGNQEDGIARDLERLWRDPGRRLDQVSLGVTISVQC